MSSRMKVVFTTKPSRSAKKLIVALVTECRAKGIQPIIRRRSKALAMEYAYRGQSRILSFPSTPSDRRAVPNAVAFFRRQLKEIDQCAA